MITENEEQILNESAITREGIEGVINVEPEALFLNGLNIGTVESGDEASATITGNAPNQLLNLVLPKGEQGDTGDIGPQGPAGQDGADGTDGITPTIGENGNWFLGETDTGKPSRGETGPAGSTSYNDITDKPKISNIELIGNKTLDELGIAAKTYVDNLIGDINGVLATLTTITEVTNGDN